MTRIYSTLAMVLLLFVAGATSAQTSSQPPAPSDRPDSSTIRGCLQGERGNYIVIANGTSMVYALRGVGNKLDGQLHHEVEVKGRVLPGVVKTGARSEKSGSNPSDTVHGIDGVPFQVSDVQRDVRVVSKHCKAAEQD